MSDTPPVPEHQTATYRAARMAVIILSALIIIALAALIVGGITHAGRKHAAPVAGQMSSFSLPKGARILSLDSQPGRLILHVRSPQGEEIDILDIADGHLVGQVKVAAP